MGPEGEERVFEGVSRGESQLNLSGPSPSGPGPLVGCGLIGQLGEGLGSGPIANHISIKGEALSNDRPISKGVDLVATGLEIKLVEERNKGEGGRTESSGRDEGERGIERTKGKDKGDEDGGNGDGTMEGEVEWWSGMGVREMPTWG